MAGVHGCKELHVRVLSRCLVMASDTSSEPHVLAVSNLDLLPQAMPVSLVFLYPRPPVADFDAVVATFEAGLPSLLNDFFPLAGRIATNPSSGLPEVHCHNQGAELVVAEADVALADLDFAEMSASLRKIKQPYGEDVALSVQVVSFSCGGFTVAWCTHHVLADGSAVYSVVSAWSELALSGKLKLSAASRPSHDRSVFRARRTPSYNAAALGEAFTAVDSRSQVNVLTFQLSFGPVERLYCIDASDVARLREEASRDGRRASRVEAISAYLWKTLAGVVGSADTLCRMGWWVDARPRLTAPDLRNYFGNVVTFVVREERVDDVARAPLSDVAAMVREAIAAPAYDEHVQELVDWVEEHKTQLNVETATLGLGSPALTLTSGVHARIDTDFGFGPAVLALPAGASAARLCSGYMGIGARDDGSLIVPAFVWPQFAESDEPRVFRHVTAEYLGLSAPQVPRSRL